ncbi:hypothetical protein ISF_03509 [Cordyceps fumosorosea ARSEF 2679]|uniref:Uncharacterized protein n=1 Tax=Cordyceps fumosorosea (strain ARSEF 2679) TaxID=1081104 RepID=A0A162LDM9_CORFA|nr:hypothetical protein ISF_03509 [Cordyceps fumosorosea ARSEF 2679]OAA69134.1 hypothetical protein ISF_03509 [Cordyceps fumosorosea ARSEF 2679]
MRYFTILAIPSILVAANDLGPRQTEQDPLTTLRANFCLEYHTRKCQEHIIECNHNKKYASIEECMPVEYPECIKDETSPCAQGIVQCITEFGGEEDAVQAVEDCITEKVMTAVDEDDEDGEDEEKKAATPEQVAACKKASAEYEVTSTVDNDCHVETEEDNSVERRAESAACKAAAEAFEQAWKTNNCETALGA